MAALPFKASKRFTMLGRPVQIGDVIDVSPLGAAKITNMEKSGYGIRVTDTQLTPERKPPASSKRGRSSTPHTAAAADAPDDDGFLDLEPEVAVAGARKPRAPKRSPRRRAAAPQ